MAQILDITERKRAEEEIRRRSKELAALYDVSLDMTAQLDLDTLLKTVLLKAIELLKANAGGLYLYHPERQDLELIVQQGLSKDYTGTRLALGEGTCGKVAQSGDPLVVTDYTNWEGRSPHFADEPTFSVLALPIKRGDTLLGALYVNDPDVERRFDDGDIRLATLFANQAAIAIDNARLFEVTKSQLAQLTALQETTGAVASTLELDKLLHLITQQATTLLQADGGIINLVDWEKKEDEVVAGSGSAAATLGYRSPLEGSLSGWATLHNQPVISNQLQNDSRADRRPRSWLVEGMKEQTQSVAIAPLTIKDQAIGTLVIMDKQGRKGGFDQTDLGLLVAFANQAATAIENARLYEETQKRLSETTVLHKVSEIINATLDLKEVFQRVVEELSKAFGYRLVDIYLLEEDGLRLQANVGYDDKTTIELIPLERGVVGRVARTKKPAFIRDVTKDPDYIPAYPEIKSEICVPVKSGETLLGTLNVESDAKRPLTNDDLQLLSTLSSHIGVAIENARLYEEEQRRSAQRHTIAGVGRRAASILEMDALLPQVVVLIAQNFGYYLVHIFQIDPGSEYAVYKAGTGKASLAIAEEGLRLKVGEEGIIGWVAGHGQPLLVNDVGQEPRYYPHPALPDTRSELAVPIHVGGRIIGVLDVQSTELNAFDEGDLETLQTLADQLAVAMENARLYQETEQLAITDGLTGLYNLRYFYETLEKEIQRSERYHRSVSLIILDIDNFKRYNDTHGHLAGDDLLKELAQLMSKVIRQTDTLARYGGEEFAIILPETETEGAGFLAERLQEEVREYRFSMQDGQTIGRITISLGVATYPHHADSAKALVDTADKALLRAKRAGKNRLSVYGEELIELKPR